MNRILTLPWLKSSYYLFFAKTVIIYYLYYFLMIVRQGQQDSFTFLFYIVAGLFLWSFWVAVLIDPGRSPVITFHYFNEHIRIPRRYCIACHSFKAERAHHCSTCNKCVLSMDHHCPWLNNCVGLYNRKPFFLLLVYLNLLLFIIIPFDCQFLIRLRDQPSESGYFRLGCFLPLLLLLYYLIKFTYFHIQLLFYNSTTLEFLHSQRLNLPFMPAQSIFNVNLLSNIKLYFGSNYLYWALPVVQHSELPNGIQWNTRRDDLAQEENDISIFNRAPQARQEQEVEENQNLSFQNQNEANQQILIENIAP